MGTLGNHGLLTKGSLLLVLSLLLLSGCTHAIPRFGMEGRYLEGRDQFLRGKGGSMDRAIVALESVARQDPTYKDTLTLLSRAYYNRGRYEDAYAIVQRALAVNKEDEVAWLVLGITRLRLGESEKGLEDLKGGITLVSKVSTNGYRAFPEWDTNGLVRSAIRRLTILALKGPEERENIIRAAEALLVRVDDEENFQRVEQPRRERRDHGG